MDKKSILVLTSTFPRWENDHEPRFVYDLCRRLTADFDITVLAPHFKGAAAKEMMDKINVHRYHYCIPRWETLTYRGGILARIKQNPFRLLLVPLFLTSQFIACIRLLRSNSFDAIHAHWIIPQCLVACLAVRLLRKTNIPILCTSHGGDLYALRGSILSHIKRWSLKRISALTVVSDAMRRDALNIAESTIDIRVMPMGVNLTTQFTPSDSASKTPSLVFVGRLVEKKGLRYLLEAMPNILTKYPVAHLRIVGDGPERQSLEILANRLGISQHTEFLGMIENRDLPDIYRQSRIAVFPFIVAGSGDQEGFGLVLVEAMGCGCAVVTTTLKAVRDIAKNEETALAVPPQDPPALANAILTLLNNDVYAQKLATAGQQFVSGNFDWYSVASNYSRLLTEMIQSTAE